MIFTKINIRYAIMRGQFSLLMYNKLIYNELPFLRNNMKETFIKVQNSSADTEHC